MTTKAEYICQFCSTDEDLLKFTSRTEWLDHMDNHKKGGLQKVGGDNKPDVEPEPEVTESPAPQKLEPISLQYKFEGQCESCGRAVDTVDIAVEEKLFMMAYCSPCKKRCAFVPVIPIDKQKFEKTK